MPNISLETGDAAELAEMLQFLAEWLAADDAHLATSLASFVGHPAYASANCAAIWTASSSCSAAVTASRFPPGSAVNDAATPGSRASAGPWPPGCTGKTAQRVADARSALPLRTAQATPAASASRPTASSHFEAGDNLAMRRDAASKATPDLPGPGAAETVSR
jgi:hypothetical protein